MKLSRMIIGFLFGSAILAGSAAAWEPTKPIQLVVGFSPGGGTDVIARAIAAGAQEVMPQPMIVINKPGASGVIAADAVSKAAPDGYTLLVAGGTAHLLVGLPEPVAPGVELAVRGTPDPGLATTCQEGEPFLVTELLTP